MTFKATIKVKKFQQVGWDTYHEEETLYLYDEDKNNLEHRIDSYENEKSRGDFGCTLSSTEYLLEKIEEVEIREEKVKRVVWEV